MSFTSTQNITASVSPTANYTATDIRAWSLFTNDFIRASGDIPFNVDDGRIFNALCMYDSVRIRSVSVSIRPLRLPDAGQTFVAYVAWDRYGYRNETSANVGLEYVRDDPSCKMKVWTPGGDASPLTHRLTAIRSDWNQYVNINRTNQAGMVVTVPANDEASSHSPLDPSLLWAFQALPTSDASINCPFLVTTRFVLTFRGASFGLPGAPQIAPDSGGFYPGIDMESGQDPLPPLES